MVTHEVLRSFPGPGSVQLVPGTLVDATDWKPGNADLLVKQRYLKAAAAGADAQPAAKATATRQRGR